MKINQYAPYLRRETPQPDSDSIDSNTRWVVPPTREGEEVVGVITYEPLPRREFQPIKSLIYVGHPTKIRSLREFEVLHTTTC